MIPVYSTIKHSEFKASLYEWAQENPNKARALSLPIAALSSLSYAGLCLVKVIESLAFAIINFVGAIFKNPNCSFKNAAESLLSLVISPIDLLAVPIAACATFGGLLFTPQKYAAKRLEDHQKTVSNFVDMRDKNIGLVQACVHQRRFKENYRILD